MYGLKTTSTAEGKQLMMKFSAPVPVRIEMNKDEHEEEKEPGVYIHFGSIFDAMNALFLVNNRS